jgi:hypothetical protein
MGCWNGTCAITNLPIIYNEEIYVLFLSEKGYGGYYGNHCHKDNYYNLLPFHFKAKYNDYGGFEDCSGDTDHVMGFIKSRLIELEEGENKCHDVPVKKKGFDLEKLDVYDHENRLTIKADSTYGKQDLRLTTIFVKQNVLDGILKNWYLEYYNGQDYMNDIKGYFKDFNKDIEKIRKGFQKLSKDLPLSLMFESFFMLVKDKIKIDDKWNFVLRTDCKLGMRYAFESLIENVHEPVKFHSIMQQIVVCALLDNFMDQGRRVWIKPSGAGSQNSSTEAQKLHSSLILKGIKDIEKREEDDDY